PLAVALSPARVSYAEVYRWKIPVHPHRLSSVPPGTGLTLAEALKRMGASGPDSLHDREKFRMLRALQGPSASAPPQVTAPALIQNDTRLAYVGNVDHGGFFNDLTTEA